MRLPRLLGVSVGLAALLLSACGKGYGTGSNGSPTPTGASAALLSASVSGIGTVLEASNGFTIYHLTTEVGGQIKCTGGCRATWPPILAPTGALPALPDGVPGTLATIDRPDGGVQLTLDGMPLYTYSGDSGPGQSNGQGVGGVWFAVSPSGSSVSPGAGRYGTPPTGY
jgi:predicted lipoprotein with Yx(FWY)xxD motif